MVVSCKVQDLFLSIEVVREKFKGLIVGGSIGFSLWIRFGKLTLGQKFVVEKEHWGSSTI